MFGMSGTVMTLAASVVLVLAGMTVFTTSLSTEVSGCRADPGPVTGSCDARDE